ncbi:MAG: ribose ABC transporter permease [Rhodospirillales bacterium]|nr:ribose ABC transporter permease [Rhodospirillales bacterium]QQS11808.1 MAG: ribose ABC transporter permease [Rhodospirillales bacterium]
MTADPAPPRQTIADRAVFLRRWLSKPFGVGSVTPSGAALGRAMAASTLDGLPPGGVVVELGAGTGPITRALLAAGLPPDRLVPVELDPALHAHLAVAFPSLKVLRGDAARLGELLRAHGVERVGAVASSLPLLSLPREIVPPILEGVFDALPPDGVLTQFTYGPASPIPADVAASLGITGIRGRRIWSNLPPAVVWRFRRRR